jgi:XTP/dITP diphosphohydrolase
MGYTLTNLLNDRTLFLGTNNKKKITELESLLGPRGFKLRAPNHFPDALDVDETGTTFEENARIKAVAQAIHRRMWAIGEDSGLCVPALRGEPGVYSARYSGSGATDASNNHLLLQRMEHVPENQRGAFYVSTIALSDPDGMVHVETRGECWGRVLRNPRGEGGFGYDPLFEIAEYHQTFAEMGAAVKHAISHRARSLRAFLRILDNLVGS